MQIQSCSGINKKINDQKDIGKIRRLNVEKKK